MPHMRSAYALLMLLVLPLTVGCLSSNTYQTAQALNPGEVEVGVALGAAYVPGVCLQGEPGGRNCLTYEAPGGSGAFDHTTVPNLGILGRIGLVEGLDLGARLWFTSASLDVKVQLLDSEHFDFAINLGGRADIVVEVGGFFSLLSTTWLSRGVGITLGVQSLLSRFADGPPDVSVSTFGMAFNFGFTFEAEGLLIRPEVTYNRYFAVLDIEPADATVSDDFGYVSMGLALQFGSDPR